MTKNTYLKILLLVLAANNTAQFSASQRAEAHDHFVLRVKDSVLGQSTVLGQPIKGLIRNIVLLPNMPNVRTNNQDELVILDIMLNLPKDPAFKLWEQRSRYAAIASYCSLSAALSLTSTVAYETLKYLVGKEAFGSAELCYMGFFGFVTASSLAYQYHYASTYKYDQNNHDIITYTSDCFPYHRNYQLLRHYVPLSKFPEYVDKVPVNTKSGNILAEYARLCNDPLIIKHSFTPLPVLSESIQPLR